MQRLKASQGNPPTYFLLRVLVSIRVIFVLCLFCAPDLLNNRSSIDDISTKLKTLEAEHESVQATLKESQANEIKLKKELEGKHALVVVELEKKLSESNERVKSLSSQLKAADAEAKEIDNIIFPKCSPPRFHLTRIFQQKSGGGN